MFGPLFSMSCVGDERFVPPMPCRPRLGIPAGVGVDICASVMMVSEAIMVLGAPGSRKPKLVSASTTSRVWAPRRRWRRAASRSVEVIDQLIFHKLVLPIRILYLPVAMI